MILTNKHEIPEEFLELRENQQAGLDPESKTIRVTTLIGSPQKAVLAYRFGEEMDVAETLNMQLGTGMHVLLQKRNEFRKNVRSESSWKKQFGDWTITGTIDLIIYKTDEESKAKYLYEIKDYKVTSVWTVIFENYNKYVSQLNVYNWLTGLRAKKLRVNLIMRDWSKKKAKTEHNYPRIPYERIDIPIWSQEEVEAYIGNQIDRIEKLMAKSDDELLNNVWCNEEERMMRNTKYAIMKNSNKTATALYNTADEAMAYLERLQSTDKKNTYTIVERKGENMCLEYCPVRHVCGLSKGAKIMEEL